MSKQVNASQQAAKHSRHLYFVVRTFDASDETNMIGFRLVDFNHGGTRDWLYYDHMPWALNNNHVVTIEKATFEEVQEYLQGALQELQQQHAA